LTKINSLAMSLGSKKRRLGPGKAELGRNDDADFVPSEVDEDEEDTVSLEQEEGEGKLEESAAAETTSNPFSSFVVDDCTEGGEIPEAKKGKKKRAKDPRDPKAPRKPKTAYIFFSNAVRDRVKGENPEISSKLGEIAKKMGEMWRGLSLSEKEPYHRLAEEDKRRYANEMENYVAEPTVEDKCGDSRAHSKIRKGKKKVKKDPMAPKKNMSSWQFFCKEKRESVREELPDASMGAVAKKLGEMWRNLSDSDKEEYNMLASADKVRYAAEKAAYGGPPDEQDGEETDGEANEEENYDDLVFTRDLEEAEPPEGLLMDLLPFQRQFLTFGLQQERGPLKGGILADEMGMGKTIQAISLILANKDDVGQYSSDVIRESRNINKMDPLLVECHAEVDRSLDYCKATLVVCPLIAVVQWYQEISNHTVPGTLKVAVYQGNKRGDLSQEALSNADVVITTYNTLEADFRRALLPVKISCKYCGKKYFPDRLKVHLRFFCGPDAEKSEALAKQESKKKPGRSQKRVVRGDRNSKTKTDDSGDLEAMDGENSEYGVDRSTEPSTSWEDIDDADAVREAKAFVGSSGDWEDRSAILAAKMIASWLRGDRESSRQKEISVLHQISWRRIVLDEAHNIKARNTNTSKAVFALNSMWRWCLSGTPLQNRVSELYSLIRFLRLNPYSYYFCSKCEECMNLTYPFQKTMEEEFVSHKSTCDHCDHGPMSHFCWWNKHVANPISKYGFSGPKGGKAMAVLKHILSQICLRRTKYQQADTLALPPRVVVLRRDSFSAIEADYYEALYTQSKVQFGGYVEAGTVLNNYAHIFDLLIRLRQAANHPYLVVFSNSNAPSRSGEPASIMTATCGLCRDPPEDPCIASCCGALFCRACALDLVDQESTGCVVCDKPLTIDFSGKLSDTVKDRRRLKTQSIISRIGNLSNFESSTKIEALREELHEMLSNSSSAKAIVFSQFTSMLDLVQFRLEQCGIKCIKLHGGMSLKQREQAITSFQDDASVKVFLMSLKAGGVALNLTCASHAFVLDLWWNSAMQCQAMDRIHRLGQFKPMRCVKFIIEGSIEERILKLQEKKAAVFEATVGGDVNSALKLSEDDFKFLFK
jgi:DNA repair protein RAD16